MEYTISILTCTLIINNLIPDHFYARKCMHAVPFSILYLSNDVKIFNTCILILVALSIMIKERYHIMKGMRQNDIDVFAYLFIFGVATWYIDQKNLHKLSGFFIGDPLAAITGRSFPIFRFSNNKSIGGSSMFFFITWSTTLSVQFSLLLTLVEFYFHHDNLFVGLVSIFWIYYQ